MWRATALVAMASMVIGCSADEPEAESISLVGRSCVKPEYGVLTNDPVTVARPGMQVGVTFHRGRGHYAVEEVFVEILRPDADFSAGDIAIIQHRNPAVLSVTAKDFEASERTVAITFNGVDSAGAPLPPGRYPAVFAATTHSTLKNCKGNSLMSGVMTTLDWKG